MVAYNYLGCVLFRNGCKYTAKLNHDSNFISIISWHKSIHSVTYHNYRKRICAVAGRVTNIWAHRD